MKVSYNWLQEYIGAPLPSAEKVAEVLTMHAFEVETIEKVGDDFVLDVDVLPNRTHDCLSHVGIAREVALLLELPLKLPHYGFEGDTSLSTTDAITLSVPAEKFVRRATKRLAIDVKVGPSPEWLKTKLETLGQRSINNIVDATNFVMFETGQPVHTFDLDKLEGARGKGKVEIQIRFAKEGEMITTLEAKSYKLEATMLVIADGTKALDIAGVKGGANSAIDENTTRVLLSACTFHPTSIRKTSRGLNLLTDASKRFEQEISPVLAEKAMHRLSEIISQIAGGKIAADIVDFYPRRAPVYKTGFAVSRVNKFLGTELSEKDMTAALDRFGWSYKKIETPLEDVVRHSQEYVGVPYKLGSSVLYDSPHTFDCSSFVAYLFANVGLSVPRISVEQYLFSEPVREEDLQLGDLIFSKGSKPYFYKEASDGIGHVGIYRGHGKIIHASGEPDSKVIIEDYTNAPKFSGSEFRGFRRIQGADEPRYVVEISPERLDIRVEEDLIEEIGRVYGYDKVAPQELSPTPAPALNKNFYYTQKIRDILVGAGFSEVMTYAFQEEGVVELANPLAEDKKYLRGTLADGLVAALEFNKKNAPLVGSPIQIFEIGTVFTKKGEHLELGIAAGNTKDVAAAFETLEKELGTSIKHKNGIANVTEYIEGLPDPKTLDDLAQIVSETRFSPISQYPFILRDIALWVPAAVSNEDVQKVISANAGEWLVRIDQFDEYKKEDKTSYAFHLVFQSNERTLTDDEVNVAMKNVEEKIKEQGWEVR